MSNELEGRIARLPAWAREYICRLQTQERPFVEEITRLRKQVEHLKTCLNRKGEQVEAMVEMFRCAAKGGNEIAAAVQEIVEDFLTNEDKT